MKPVCLVAEIGCNHQGDERRAFEMAEAALRAGAQVIKFQKRDPRTLLSPAEYAAPHPHPQHSFGASYGEHREFLELTLEQQARLKSYIEERGGIYSCSVWDQVSAREIMSLKPSYIKIPSAMNLNFALLAILTREYEGDLHISLGMATSAETERLVDFLRQESALERTVLYACTSAYPASASELFLGEITRLKNLYPELRDVGFSGHQLGSEWDVVAGALGAVWVERHFTTHRQLKGTDQSFSLEPREMADLARRLRELEDVLRVKPAAGAPSEGRTRQYFHRKEIASPV